MTDDVYEIVLIQAEAVKKGALTMWTVYERPKDYPCGFVARMFEIKNGAARPKPTMKTMKSLDLGPIQEKLMNAGLTCIGREAADEPHIVETWL